MTSKRHFGTVRRRDSGRWQALYFHAGKTHSAGTFNTKADALIRLSQVETDLHRGAWVDPQAGKTTLEASYRRFLERRLRERYGFAGTPIDLSVKAREKGKRGGR